ncbi:ATP-binding protein [Clostridium aminobutyricum]|uniref:ATP-binding protein n=1 Tax=Clostridium aminobutyricum TaxID=33953 RepID=A0A939IKC8_CLOAM|nr:ATP-binding protein [Clostridium aminobutyricum]MBN7774508.1 ATP-binding protein [Clostridium aminobutyricum]
MNKLYSLSTKLNTLVIFRNLLENPVIKSLQTLAGETYHLKSSEEIIKSYGSFVSALFNNTCCLSDYIVELAMNDENFYIVGKGAGKEFDPVVEDCLENELHILNQLAALTAKETKTTIPYADYLPEWINKDIDIRSLYYERIKNLPVTGYGIYVRYAAFVLTEEGIMPVKYPDPQSLSQLQGYERERNLVIQNTLSLLHGTGANNVLLYGDAGTGKSSTIKAILNEFKDQGLRLIEIKKDQLLQLPNLLEELSVNPLKFILFIDDLSFSSNDDSFSTLKAVLEGSVASRSHNVAIYATSNRRHLVKENMSDRNGDDLHLNDTLQETLSLSARFGLKITFQVPDKQDYLDIVLHLAKESGLTLPQDSLFVKAEAFAIRNGGRSPRTAKQFVQTQSILQKSEGILQP